jgi:hypothetical protein
LPIIPDTRRLDTTIQNASNLAHEAIQYYSTRAART